MTRLEMPQPPLYRLTSRHTNPRSCDPACPLQVLNLSGNNLLSEHFDLLHIRCALDNPYVALMQPLHCPCIAVMYTHVPHTLHFTPPLARTLPSPACSTTTRCAGWTCGPTPVTTALPRCALSRPVPPRLVPYCPALSRPALSRPAKNPVPPPSPSSPRAPSSPLPSPHHPPPHLMPPPLPHPPHLVPPAPPCPTPPHHTLCPLPHPPPRPLAQVAEEIESLVHRNEYNARQPSEFDDE